MTSHWSIGIYQGPSITELEPAALASNPVISAQSITDEIAQFVADPFMIFYQGKWFMFFEVMSQIENKGVIGLAESNDALHWQYRRIVLKEDFHISYPYVFSHNNEFFLLPETRQAKCLRLYRAQPFPLNWRYHRTLIEEELVDASIFQLQNHWWILACGKPFNNKTLRLYHADRLVGPWREHPKSPLLTENKILARPAGRVLSQTKHPIRFAQTCQKKYGMAVHGLEIITLNKQDYKDRLIDTRPLLKGSGQGWNGKRMHHIDAHQLSQNHWIACVDGCE